MRRRSRRVEGKEGQRQGERSCNPVCVHPQWLPRKRPRNKGAVDFKRIARADEKVRANHARNFLDCVKSRKPPVENLKIGHHVSAVAQLGNIALRSKSRIEWDAEAGRVKDNPAANEFVIPHYRAPWKLA